MIIVTLYSRIELGLKMQKYNYDELEMIRSLTVREYKPETHQWVIPADRLQELRRKAGKNYIDLDVVPEAEPLAEIVRADREAETEKMAQQTLQLVREHRFKVAPYDHQISGISFCLQHVYCMLCDEQGLGKTEQGIMTAEIRMQLGLVKKVLIISGVNGVKYTWQREIAMHTDNEAIIIDGSAAHRIKMIAEWSKNDVPYAIINIEMLRKTDLLSALNGIADMIILDECHKAKNRKCKQGEGLHQLQAKYKLAMTGTPMTSKVEDVWNVISWLGVEPRSYWTFCNAYCRMNTYGQAIEYFDLDELNDRMSEYMLRRKKEEVLDLPPKIHQ